MDKDIAEIKSDVKTLIEISKLTQHEQEKKNEVLFDFMNETNKTLGRLEESSKDNKEYVGSVSSALKDHKRNHFSWLKMVGVAIGSIGGIVGIVEWIKGAK